MTHARVVAGLATGVLGVGLLAGLPTAQAASAPTPPSAGALAPNPLDYSVSVDPPARAPPSTPRCTASSTRTSTGPPTAASTPSSCRTAPSSTPPPTTAATPDSPPGRARHGRRHRHRGDRGRRRPPERAQPHLPAARPHEPHRRHVRRQQRRLQHRCPPRGRQDVRLLGLGSHRLPRRHAAHRHPARCSPHDGIRLARDRGRLRRHVDEVPGTFVATASTTRAARGRGRRAPARCASTWCRCSRGTRTRADRTGCARTSPRRSPPCTPASSASPAAASSTPAACTPTTPRQLPARALATSGRTPSARSSSAPTNSNFWGYNQTYGLGYYEYFQFSEDIGADAAARGPGARHRLRPEPGHRRRRAAPAAHPGHPRPHRVRQRPGHQRVGRQARARWATRRRSASTHIAVGNEENLPDAYFASFVKFRAAIEAKYPDITVISNSGPDDTGSTFDRLWELNAAPRRRHGRRALLQQPGLVPAEQRPLRLLRPQRPEGLPRRVRLAGQQAATTRSPRPPT